MTTVQLVRRSLTHYWRTNVAVVCGTAIAVSVLAGAAMVGDSVRASLRELFLQRLGNTHSVVTGPVFFREQLAADLEAGACPMMVLEGVVNNGSRRASGVQVYGVDGRFWEFHGRDPKMAPGGRDVLLSEALARELGVDAGGSVIVRVEKPSAIPKEFLHGRKDDSGLAMRSTVRTVLDASGLGEFSLRAGQSAVRAVFIPLSQLQRTTEQTGRVNTILTRATPTLKSAVRLEDLGIKIRQLDAERGLSVETESTLINDALAESIRRTAEGDTLPSFTYLANGMRVGSRQVPYSLVTAIDLARLGYSGGNPSAILLNEWAAQELGAKTGDAVEVEYYLWKDEGQLVTEKASFTVAGVLPIRGLAADRDFTPEYPGITEAKTIADWDPPFPMDLSLIRPKDEEYWDRYRTTPKAFIPLATGQKLWQSRFGTLTSVRVSPRPANFAAKLRDSVDPIESGLTVYAVRAEGLAAAQGSTDFGEYFAYFSFFLVVSALLLVGLFFRLGVEQRLREIGILSAVGFHPEKIRNLFLAEGLFLASGGALLGIAGAAVYAGLIVLGLRTWWVGAVGTTMISLHVTAAPLLGGMLAGIAMALACIALTLRSLRKTSARALLHGSLESWETGSTTRPRRGLKTALALACGGAAVGVLFLDDQVSGFFGSGMLLLAGLLLAQSSVLARGLARGSVGVRSVAKLGFRNTSYRPGRSVLAIALIAFATFIIVAIDVFRRDADTSHTDRKSGTGGYALMAESVLPIYDNPNATVKDVVDARLVSFRLRPGEDASCLNLYRPRNPRILGAPASFVREGRFSFQSSLAATVEEKENPWLLLEKDSGDGTVPAIGDATSLAYALHLKLGDVLELKREDGTPLRLRLVGALRDSIFQRELMVSEASFVRAFPKEQGFRVFLVDTPESLKSGDTAAALETAFSDFGFDAIESSERLAGFHRVENTYLSTFQTLGALGLLLGTAGLAAILLRNVLERRRELALLEAVGFRPRDLSITILAENVFLMLAGLATGTVCAAIAVLPAVIERGGQPPLGSVALLLAGVLVTGLLASLLAIRVAVRSSLLPALRSE